VRGRSRIKFRSGQLPRGEDALALIRSFSAWLGTPLADEFVSADLVE